MQFKWCNSKNVKYKMAFLIVSAVLAINWECITNCHKSYNVLIINLKLKTIWTIIYQQSRCFMFHLLFSIFFLFIRSMFIFCWCNFWVMPQMLHFSSLQKLSTQILSFQLTTFHRSNYAKGIWIIQQIVFGNYLRLDSYSYSLNMDVNYGF